MPLRKPRPGTDSRRRHGGGRGRVEPRPRHLLSVAGCSSAPGSSPPPAPHGALFRGPRSAAGGAPRPHLLPVRLSWRVTLRGDVASPQLPEQLHGPLHTAQRSPVARLCGCWVLTARARLPALPPRCSACPAPTPMDMTPTNDSPTQHRSSTRQLPARGLVLANMCQIRGTHSPAARAARSRRSTPSHRPGGLSVVASVTSQPVPGQNKLVEYQKVTVHHRWECEASLLPSSGCLVTSPVLGHSQVTGP